MSKGHRDKVYVCTDMCFCFLGSMKWKKNNNNCGRLWQYYEFTEKVTACTL